MIKKFSTKLISRKKIAKDTLELRLKRPKNFNFLAGQSIVLISNGKINDKRGSAKSFSISSSPREKKYLSISFRVPDKHSDFKKNLKKEKINSLIEIIGPKGNFTLPKKTSKKITFIAGGIGISPFISMIKDNSKDKNPKKINLFYTDKSEKLMAYLKELKKEKKNLFLSYQFKRLNKTFLKKYPNLKDSIFYICGNPKMVQNIKKILTSLEVKPEDIITEEYSGY